MGRSMCSLTKMCFFQIHGAASGDQIWDAPGINPVQQHLPVSELNYLFRQVVLELHPYPNFFRQPEVNWKSTGTLLLFQL